MIDYWHSWGHMLTMALFDQASNNAWLHIVVHIVLIGMPALFVGMLVKVIYRFIRTRPDRDFTPKKRYEYGLHHQLPASIFEFIVRYSLKPQILLSIGALTAIPITYASLELPKRIINSAMNTANFTASDISLSLTQIDYLWILSGLYLLVLILNAILKFLLNYYKGSMAEHLIKRLRLYILQKDLKSTSRNKNTIPVIIQEVEPVCGFSGDSFTIPFLQGGIVLTILTFMMLQNFVLGVAAITLLPIQIIIIPRFQKKINLLVRQRVGLIRQLSKEFSYLDSPDNKSCSSKESRGIFTSIHGVRLKIFKTKFIMKSLNNFIMNLTPFFFYTIGGYLVIGGQLSLGALVAVLASHKDLNASIRDLFTYYQTYQDVKVRYREIGNYLDSLVMVGNSQKGILPFPSGTSVIITATSKTQSNSSSV